MFINRISGHTHANIPRAVLGQVNLFHSFFSHFFDEQHGGNFSITIKIIDKAEDVFSLRRKELFWQYKLGTFAPAGLNERAADVELDMFACGVA